MDEYSTLCVVDVAGNTKFMAQHTAVVMEMRAGLASDADSSINKVPQGDFRQQHSLILPTVHNPFMAFSTSSEQDDGVPTLDDSNSVETSFRESQNTYVRSGLLDITHVKLIVVLLRGPYNEPPRCGCGGGCSHGGCEAMDIDYGG